MFSLKSVTACKTFERFFSIAGTVRSSASPQR
jgi:hypothetical protein